MGVKWMAPTPLCTTYPFLVGGMVGDYLSLALSWLAKANLAAFSCSLANLFSYLETFLRVGLMNLPFMSMTRSLSSALRSCSFLSSSAAFLRRRVLSFFFLSGVMNPFFLAMAAAGLLLLCPVLHEILVRSPM